MEVIFTAAEVDLSVTKVFNQNLGPLFEVYIWERFIMPQEFSSLSESKILSSSQSSLDTALYIIHSRKKITLKIFGVVKA